MEKRKPDFTFQAYKRPENTKGSKAWKPKHLSSFELFQARLWKGVKRVSELYGETNPLAGLFRLRVDKKWFRVGGDYMFLTFHEAWRVMGSMASDTLGFPAAWEESNTKLRRGDRVKVMDKQGYCTTVINRTPWLDGQGIEWVTVTNFADPIPANALILPAAKSGGRYNAYTNFSKALQKFKKDGGVLWYWPEHPDHTPPYPSSWEVISPETAIIRGIDPKQATVLALEMGGLDLHQAEALFQKISS